MGAVFGTTYSKEHQLNQPKSLRLSTRIIPIENMNFKIAILFVSFLMAVALAQEPSKPDSPECAKSFQRHFMQALRGEPHWKHSWEDLASEFNAALGYASRKRDQQHKGCQFPEKWEKQCSVFF